MSSFRLASGTISSTTLITLYTFGAKTNSARLDPLVLTNNTSSIIEVSVYINGVLAKKQNIPSGQGRSAYIMEIAGGYNSSDYIAIQASSANSFNYYLSGQVS